MTIIVLVLTKQLRYMKRVIKLLRLLETVLFTDTDVFVDRKQLYWAYVFWHCCRGKFNNCLLSKYT